MGIYISIYLLRPLGIIPLFYADLTIKMYFCQRELMLKGAKLALIQFSVSFQINYGLILEVMHCLIDGTIYFRMIMK